MTSAVPSRLTAIRLEACSLWTLAWPMLVGQLATVGMGVADVAMTGHASAQDLAAVSLGTAVWTMVIVTVIGIMMASNSILAHEAGAGQHERIAHLVRQALWLGFGIGILACLATNSMVHILDYLGLEGNDEVRDKAATFIHIISLGLPALAAYRALYAYSTSVHQTKPIMLIALGGLLWNIAINWLLVYGHCGLPPLGAVGCAVATASGLWLMLGAMLLWIRHAPAYRATSPFSRFEMPNRVEIGAMLKLGLPIGVTYFAEVSAFAGVGLLVARFGVVTMSAHQIALNFSSLVFMVPMSFGIALITRVASALGERDPVQARFASWVGMGMSLSFAVFSALLIVLFRRQIAAAYSSDLQVQEMAQHLLLFAALFQLSDATQVAGASAVRGYKVTRMPMIIHLVAFWGVSIPLGCILGLAPQWLAWRPSAPMGAAGFWIGLVFGLSVAAAALSWLLDRISRLRISEA